MPCLNFAPNATAMHYADRRRLLALLENRSLLTGRKIALFGAGLRGALFAAVLEQAGCRDLVFLDNDPAKQGGFMNAYPILAPEAACSRRSEYVIIITAEKNSDIKIQLRNLGQTENKDFFAVDTDLYAEYLDEFLRPASGGHLFMGDCGLTHIALDDMETENLAALLKKTFGPERAKVLAMHGMNVKDYYHMLKEQLRLGYKPEAVVMMLHPATLHSKFQIMPSSQHPELFKKICRSLDQADQETLEHLELTEKRSRSLLVHVASAKNRHQAPEHANEKLLMKLNYMHRLRRDTDPMLYLPRVIALSREYRFKLVLFIPPVNHEWGEKLWPGEFTRAYETLVADLQSFVSEHHGPDILDLSFILPLDHFSAPSTTGEVANHRGRQVVLRAIIDHLEQVAQEAADARKI